MSTSDIIIVIGVVIIGIVLGPTIKKIKRKIKARKTVCHISSIYTSLFYVHDDWLLYDHVFS